MQVQSLVIQAKNLLPGIGLAVALVEIPKYSNHQDRETIPGGYHTLDSREYSQLPCWVFVLAKESQSSSLVEVQNYQVLHDQR